MTEHAITIAVLAATDDGPIAHWARTGERITHSAPLPPGVHTLAWMESAGVDQAWCYGAWGRAVDTPDGWTAGPHSDTWHVYYHQGVYGAREVAVPHEDARSPWRDAKSPLTLLRALRLYANEVGPWRWGPGATGTRLMRELFPQAAPCGNLPDVARRGAVERPLAWSRPVRDDELRPGRWIHAYDRNGLFLAACSSVELGLGDCTHWERHADYYGLAGDATGRPGYWRLRITAAPEGAPAAMLPGERDWITTPTLKLFVDLGMGCDLLEAYTWPSPARALEPWYARLRDARTALLARDDAPARLALAALKATYSQAIARLGGRRPDHAESLPAGQLPPDATHRAVFGGAPDWRHQIIATASANMYRAVKKLEVAGLDVLGVGDVDTVYVLADDAHHLSPGIPLGTGLGQWKHKGSVAADDPRFAGRVTVGRAATLIRADREAGHAGT